MPSSIKRDEKQVYKQMPRFHGESITGVGAQTQYLLTTADLKALGAGMM